MAARKICDICGVKFTVNSNKQKRCSKECKNKADAKLRSDWNKANKERVVKLKKDWKEENKDKEAENLRRWQENNRDRANNICAKRRANKLSATLSGFDDEILIIYKKAKELELQDGVNREVHHMIPLIEYNDLVCGLHVPWNLEVLTEQEHYKAHEELKEVYGRASSNLNS
jgi:hypothetical protein